MFIKAFLITQGQPYNEMLSIKKHYLQYVFSDVKNTGKNMKYVKY